MRDLLNNLDYKRGLSPVAVLTNLDTPYVSEILDMRGQDSAVFVILVGANTDANATFTVLAEEGDVSTLSDNTAIDDADLIGTEVLASFTAADDDNKIKKLGIRASGKRYKRVTITPSGNNSGNALVAGVWITSPLIVPSDNPPA